MYACVSVKYIYIYIYNEVILNYLCLSLFFIFKAKNKLNKLFEIKPVNPKGNQP